jgi:hypothetical protein
MLAEYGIPPHQSRYPDGTQRRGFTRGDFADAWSRYCPTELDQDGAGTVVDPGPSHSSTWKQPSSARDGSPPWEGQPVPPTQPVPP